MSKYQQDSLGTRMKKYSHDNLGTRMKTYEVVSQTALIRRMPVIIRLDGRAFHTWTKRLKHLDPLLAESPFSPMMHDAMTRTTEALVQSVQNCAFAYTQSDEISLLLRDWDTLETDAWFSNGVQKMCSSSAADATAAFNFFFWKDNATQPHKLTDLAKFDARVFNLPREEVANYFIWRQNDASRNSVQMLGHYHFSQKQMHGKNNSVVQDMLMQEKQINWNDVKTWAKRGTCVYRKSGETTTNLEIPIFTQDRSFVDRHMLTPTEVEALQGKEG